METRLAIASKRDERRYDGRPVAKEIEERILDAGRVSGSSQNKQRWEFVVVEAAKEQLADAVYAPGNLRGAGLVIAIVGEAGSLDVGRCAQNMMLAAWDQGVISCPNGIRDAETAAGICGSEVRIILSFGYPQTPRNVERRSVEEWSAHANRKPLDQLVRRV
jgi:nitroreductase